MYGEGYSKIELNNIYKYKKNKFKIFKRKNYSKFVKTPLLEYDCVNLDDINFYQSTIKF